MTDGIIMVTTTSDRLNALMEMLREFYADSSSPEGIRALAAFEKSITPMTEDGEQALRDISNRFGWWFTQANGIRPRAITGEPYGALLDHWLIAVRLGIEIGVATLRVADN